VLNLADLSNRDPWVNLDEVYSLSRFDLVVATEEGSVTRYPGLSFASRVALLAWLNANVPSDGSAFLASATMTAWDEVDQSMPPVTKVWGKNGALSRLRKNDFYKSPSRGYVELNSWPDLDVFLAAAWEAVWPGDPLPSPLTPDVRAAFWWAKNRRNLYEIEKSFGIQPSFGRTSRAGAGGPFGPTGTGFSWAYQSSGDPAYGIVDSSGGGFVQVLPLSQFRRDNRKISDAGRSAVFLAPIQGGVNERAVWIKPVGIDQIYLSWFDPTLYRAEAIVTPNIDGKREARVLTASRSPSVVRDASGAFTKDQWYRGQQISVSQGGHRHGPGRCHFYLRELATGKVSELSTARVEYLDDRTLSAGMARVVS